MRMDEPNNVISFPNIYDDIASKNEWDTEFRWLKKTLHQKNRKEIIQINKFFRTWHCECKIYSGELIGPRLIKYLTGSAQEEERLG